MTLKHAFEEQADHCIALGSPFMGQLMNVLKNDWPSDSALGRKLAGFEGDVGPMGASLPLRIAAGLHALVLQHKAPGLAAVYPPHEVTNAVLSDAVLEALQTHEAFLLEWIDHAPQTNEVRRSAALIAGARVAVQHFNLPIYLSELGASGGLNLMWDHFLLEIDGHRFGSALSTILLSPKWTGGLPPSVQPRIEKRRGVDLNPLDPTRRDHLLRLMAYMWADQPERLNLTRSAASVLEAKVHQDDAIDWLARQLPAAPEGRLHLIQHTIAWQYFPKAAQIRGTALIEAAGKRATKNRPLAWLSMESDGLDQQGAALTLRMWPGDIRLDLGRVDFHGRWIDWKYSG
ncbi:MAG TPA: DUF2332 family protein [Roseobacter sp.]|uniref:DUF2332 domain-containing protein n=1 Tax=marine sediment metagenome TaxID=412755 RepID=A0A0F9R3N5_9ZZZZ|nr:DUF2332 family protein [Roseobacter sp.]HEC71043.1 DUF2332 family protein [Roseobacter sp.]